MDWKIFSTVFITMLIAELGDKTQLAVMNFTAKSQSMLSVFLGASLALVVSTGIAVLFGETISRIIPPSILHIISALLFISLGIWILIRP